MSYLVLDTCIGIRLFRAYRAFITLTHPITIWTWCSANTSLKGHSQVLHLLWGTLLEQSNLRLLSVFLYILSCYESIGVRTIDQDVIRPTAELKLLGLRLLEDLLEFLWTALSRNFLKVLKRQKIWRECFETKSVSRMSRRFRKKCEVANLRFDEKSECNKN